MYPYKWAIKMKRIDEPDSRCSNHRNRTIARLSLISFGQEGIRFSLRRCWITVTNTQFPFPAESAIIALLLINIISSTFWTRQYHLSIHRMNLKAVEDEKSYHSRNWDRVSEVTMILIVAAELYIGVNINVHTWYSVSKWLEQIFVSAV